jgi:hypothetical protein
VKFEMPMAGTPACRAAASGSGGMSATTRRARSPARNAASRPIQASPPARNAWAAASVAGMSTSRLPRWTAPVSTGPGSRRTDAGTPRANSHGATEVRTTIATSGRRSASALMIAVWRTA